MVRFVWLRCRECSYFYVDVMGRSTVFVEKCVDDTVVLFAIFEDQRPLYEGLLLNSRLPPYYVVVIVEDVLGCFDTVGHYNWYFCYNYMGNCYNCCYLDSGFDNLCFDHSNSNDCRNCLVNTLDCYKKVEYCLCLVDVCAFVPGRLSTAHK